MTQLVGRPKVAPPPPPEKRLFGLPYAVASNGPISLGRGRGGPRCMTCPIEREAVSR